MAFPASVAPPPELMEVCENLYDAAGLLLNDVREPFPTLGYYESDVEARILFIQLLRHLEALLECARSDLVLLPEASTIARAIFEQGIKIRWLLQPTDVFDREARFLAHLSDEERMWERCARYRPNAIWRDYSLRIQAFRKRVEAALPPGINRLARIPPLNDMLIDLGARDKYVEFIMLSQFAHGSHFGGSIYRRQLGTMKTFGEQVTAREWAGLLQISWWSFFNAGQTIEHVGAERELRSIGAATIDAIGARLIAIAAG